MNNKIYKIIEHKGLLSAIFASITILSGAYGFYEASGHNEIIYSFIKAFKFFSFDFPAREELNYFTIVAFISAVITIALTAVLFFFKEQINKMIYKKIKNKNHIAIFGLGKIARTFLEDCSLDTNVIIIEQNSLYAEEYREKGFGVQIGDAFDKDFLNKYLNFNAMEYALIAFGNDKLNIEFAKKIISVYKEKDIETSIKLIVHIHDKKLSRLFSKSFILGNSNAHAKINIKTFSYYEECARDLYSKYSIDGDTLEYMNSGKTLNTVVIGDNDLVKNIVYKIIALSHFPKKNRHIVHVVHKTASKLLEEIKTYINYDEAKFPTIDLVAIDIDYKKQDFYTDKIWNEESIENIIVCYDDESINIELGTTLHEKVFLSDTIDNIKVPKIIMAVYEELELSNSINENKCEYKNMFTFGSQKDIANKEHLLNEMIDSISKLIHKGYGNEYKPKYIEEDKKALDEEWFDGTKFSDKLSNISQARHIDMKLKALGLRKIESNKEINKLLEDNRKLLNNALDITGDDEIEKFKVEFWEKPKEDNLFNKLTHIEHERWCTHHYLEGWKYSKTRNKNKKEHNCLLPLDEFTTKDIQRLVVFDMYSFLYLPNYLAQEGYEIVPFKTKKLGVTGHRKIDKQTEEKIYNEIKKLDYEGISHIVTPLAEGSDRVVAKYAMNELGAKLVVPIPFELKKYKETFEETELEFEEILECAKELGKLNKEKDNKKELYKKCGEYVVDNCDILIAIWDGEEAKDVGGTGDIVKYAKDNKKYIVHINSKTQEVVHINKPKKANNGN